MNCCEEHSGHSVRLTQVERETDKQWERLDGMKNWVIAGMGGLLVQALVFILGIMWYLTTRHSGV